MKPDWMLKVSLLTLLWGMVLRGSARRALDMFVSLSPERGIPSVGGELGWDPVELAPCPTLWLGFDTEGGGVFKPPVTPTRVGGIFEAPKD
jgi:hypothetical protein